MNFRHVRMLLLLFTMILWNVLLNAWILERTRQINCFSYETALYSFRKHRVSGELLARMQDRKVGIDITIFLLCFSYKVYCVISKFFKCLIRFIGEGVGNGFKPFGKVGILK